MSAIKIGKNTIRWISHIHSAKVNECDFTICYIRGCTPTGYTEETWVFPTPEKAQAQLDRLLEAMNQ